MTIAEYCVFAAVVLYLLTLAPAKVGGHKEFKNSDPRDPAFYAPPQRARVLGAHQNGFEAFPFFMGAVLLAEFRAAPQAWIDGLAALFLILRFAYVAAYLGNRPTLRTTIWTSGFLVNAAIFFLPLVRR
jgi:uncharacterized MAPEG superfamily protein